MRRKRFVVLLILVLGLVGAFSFGAVAQSSSTLFARDQQPTYNQPLSVGYGYGYSTPVPAAPAVTSCTVGADGRVNGQCGDRVVVYCNPPYSIYGISDDGHTGILLGSFTAAALKAAGKTGLSVNDGVNGIISMSVDAQGNFWAAWNGGQFHANGQGIFAKGGHC